MTDSWQRSHSLTPERRLEVLNLLNRTETRLGREAIDEGRRRIVVHGWPAEHWLQHHEGLLVNYAMAMGTKRATVEMCGGDVDTDLLHNLLQHHESIDWWTRGSQIPVHSQCQVIRTLQLMQVALPVATVGVPEGATLRNYEPGRDEDAWLVQNNAAFFHHPEQGAWLRADLDMRTSEPWFDPSGFLLLEIDGRLAASCWTKVHELHPDRFGEIYIISVHPDFQGRNLGRVMVTQGLDVLRKKGVSTAILFVDQSNKSAVALYESLGFKVERDDRLLRFERN
jgi:mycothiol synthase